jgi:ribonucleoside-diphosphate reductase alpha chain
MKLEGIRHKVFLDRYSLKDVEGKPLEQTPDEMWHRVAKGIAGVEKTAANKKKWEQKFYEVMEDFKFLPGGRIFAGAGTGFDVTYFNCFVIPNPKDSRGEIMKNLTQMIEIMAHGGGVGLNLSGLRPRGSRVKKVNGFSSGPMNWAELYSLATKDIVQQGGSRRGALMLMLHDWHPDVEEFITVKQDLTKINGANLSVCVSDDFMDAVKNDRDWDLLYPDLDDPNYDKEWDGDIHDWKAAGRKVKVYKTVKASYLWNLICEAAWRSAEPGLHFLDRSNKRSNTWYFEKLLATNPCGEQPLGAWAVCNLGAMNLSAYVKDDDLKNDKAGWFDYESFGKDVQVAMRFLDNVIDDTHYFFDENEKVAKDIRRTGLGIMGIADAFIKMKVRYGSEESEKIAKKMFETLRDNAYIASADIAKEKGSFPKYDRDKYLEGYHIKALPKDVREKIYKQGIRNAVLLTIAPTGTTSLIAGVSSGVEPVYEFEYSHNGRLGKQMVYHSLYGEWKESHADEKRPDYFVAANDLTPEDHVKIQAIAQEYIDASISKTVNAPNSHTVEDVKKLYMMSYDMGLKGVTYFRDGSRMGVLQREEKKEEKKIDQNVEKPLVPVTPRMPRPMMLSGVTYKTDSPSGKMYVTINEDEKGDMFEVFVNQGKSGSDLMALADALGRMISFVLRIHSPVPARERVREIISELSGIGGARSIGFGENRVRSLPDAIAKVLAKHGDFKVNGKVEDRTPVTPILADGGASKSNGHLTNGKANVETEATMHQLSLPNSGMPATTTSVSASGSSTSLFDLCPKCGSSTLAYEEGCKKCYGCGYSEC